MKNKLKVSLFSVLVGCVLTTVPFSEVSAEVVDSKQSQVSITFTEGDKGVSVKNHEVSSKEDNLNTTEDKTKLSDIDFVTDYKLNVRYVNPELGLNLTEGVYNLKLKDLNSVEYKTTKEGGKTKTGIIYNKTEDYLLGKEYINLTDGKGISNINLTLEDLNKLGEDKSKGYVEYVFVDGV